jgi:hypothetical protein
VERQLCGAPDHLGGFPRVLQPGQLDDDPPVAGAGEAGLGHAERVDPAAQHLDRPVGRLLPGLHGRGVLGLEHDLGAAAQVEAEAGGGAHGEVDGPGEDAQRQQGADERCGHGGNSCAAGPPRGSRVRVAGRRSGSDAQRRRRCPSAVAPCRTPDRCRHRASPRDDPAEQAGQQRCRQDGCDPGRAGTPDQRRLGCADLGGGGCGPLAVQAPGRVADLTQRPRTSRCRGGSRVPLAPGDG